MEDMQDLEMTCFEIISNVGMARSCYIEAIDLALEGNIDDAMAKIEEGREFYLAGHSAHGRMIQSEAAGDTVQPCLLLIHAEDQLMSAETFQILAEKFCVLARRLDETN